MGLYEDRVKRLHDHVMRNQEKTEVEQTDLSKLKNDELKALLDEKGIEYDTKANKETLIELLEGAE